MANHEAIEQRLVRSLVAPPRDVYLVDPKDTLEETIKKSLLKGYEIAQTAWGHAQERAVSYRDFVVGVGAIVVDACSYELSVVYGYNVKLGEGEVPNIHAEDMVQAQLEFYGGYIIGLIVAGAPQPDDASGLDLPTLMPCSARCVPRLRSNARVLDSALVMGIHPGSGATTTVRLDDIHIMYNGSLRPSCLEGPEDAAAWKDAMAIEIVQAVPDIASALRSCPTTTSREKLVSGLVYEVGPQTYAGDDTLKEHGVALVNDYRLVPVTISLHEGLGTLILTKPNATNYIGLL